MKFLVFFFFLFCFLLVLGYRILENLFWDFWFLFVRLFALVGIGFRIFFWGEFYFLGSWLSVSWLIQVVLFRWWDGFISIFFSSFNFHCEACGGERELEGEARVLTFGGVFLDFCFCKELSLIFFPLWRIWIWVSILDYLLTDGSVTVLGDLSFYFS